MEVVYYAARVWVTHLVTGRVSAHRSLWRASKRDDMLSEDH